MIENMTRAGYRVYLGEDIFKAPPTPKDIQKMNRRFLREIFYDYDYHLLFVKG